MKKYLLLFCFLMTQLTFAQMQNVNYNSLVATEFAFAASVSELGTRDAFLKFIADDGILFRPNPVNGKEFLNNSQKRPGLLSWYPSFAEISKSGDMGFTTGPAEYRKDKDSAAIWFGNFCTVWQKQANGDWKFVIDFGINHSKPENKPEPIKYEIIKSSAFSLVRSSKKIKANELIELDNQLNLLSAKMGLSTIYMKFTNQNSRLMRENEFPHIGSQIICKYLEKIQYKVRFNPIDGKISLGKDLGYTYGVMTISNGSETSDSYYYFHVWKKERKRWIILADVTNRIQK